MHRQVGHPEVQEAALPDAQELARARASCRSFSAIWKPSDGLHHDLQSSAPLPASASRHTRETRRTVLRRGPRAPEAGAAWTVRNAPRAPPPCRWRWPRRRPLPPRSSPPGAGCGRRRSPPSPGPFPPRGRASGSAPWARRDRSCSRSSSKADCASLTPSASDSSMRGYTKYACLPFSSSSPTRRYTFCSLPSRARCVTTGSRPTGMVRMEDTSRSPNAVRASVRGIGVAVMRSRSGLSPFFEDRLPLQDAELVLLVDDHQPQVMEGHILGEKRVGAEQEVHLARPQRRRGAARAAPRSPSRREKRCGPPAAPAAARRSPRAGAPAAPSGPGRPPARRRRPPAGPKAARRASSAAHVALEEPRHGDRGRTAPSRFRPRRSPGQR